MRATPRIGTAVVLWGLGLAPGCAGGVPEAVQSSEHVSLYYPIDGPVPCAGTATWLSDVAARQGAFLGLPPLEPIAYHVRPGGERWPCPEGADGCAEPDGTLWARAPTLTHELVHALVAQHDLRPTAFFEEGLAVALGERAHVERPDYEAQLTPLLESTPVPFEAFPLAGALATHLLRTDGPDRYIELLESTRRDFTADEAMAAFALVYGRPLEVAIDEARAAPRLESNRLSFPECARNASPWSGDAWSVTRNMECSEPTVGPLLRSLPPLMVRHELLDVPTAGAYEVRATGEGGFADLHRCEDDARSVLLVLERDDDGEDTAVIDLEAGLHYLELESYIDRPAEMTLTLRPGQR